MAVAASVAGAALVPQSAHVSATMAVNTFEQTDCRGLVLHAALLERPEWLTVLPSLRAKLDGRPLMLQGDSPATDGIELQFEEALLTGPLISSARPAPCQPCLVLSTGGTTGQAEDIIHCSESLVFAATRFRRSRIHRGRGPGRVRALRSRRRLGVRDLHAAALRRLDTAGRSVAAAAGRRGDRGVGRDVVHHDGHPHLRPAALDPRPLDACAPMRIITSGAGPDSLFEDGERELGFPMVIRVFGCSECPGHAIGRLDDPAQIRLRQDGVPFAGWSTGSSTLLAGQWTTAGEPASISVPWAPTCSWATRASPELTAQSVTEDGFYRSGDLMVMSPQGYLSWRGRTRDIIGRGGLRSTRSRWRACSPSTPSCRWRL